MKRPRIGRGHSVLLKWQSSALRCIRGGRKGPSGKALISRLKSRDFGPYAIHGRAKARKGKDWMYIWNDLSDLLLGRLG